MSAVRVVGLGQPLAGDDGVGHAVIDALEALAMTGLVLSRLREASALVDLMSCPDPLIVVDAVVGASTIGSVHVLGEAALDASPMSAVSSHGLGVAQAVAMGRVLYGGEAAGVPVVHFVAIAIEAPRARGQGLSLEVEAAVPEAVRRVVELVESVELVGSAESAEGR